jgi:hypothetical protein
MVEASTELRNSDIHVVVDFARSKVPERAEKAVVKRLSQRFDFLEVEPVVVTPLESLR